MNGLVVGSSEKTVTAKSLVTNAGFPFGQLTKNLPFAKKKKAVK
jgi:hypothetical protein